MVLALALIWRFANENRSTPVAETEIFVGVRYGCRILSHTEEGSGPMHWVRVDLSAPGVGLYVTPKDHSLEASGYQYRLHRVGTVVETERLAVAVNGSMFTKEPAWIPGYWPGQRANGLETVVANGRVSHLWEHTYLLWFDAELIPTLENRKPPLESTLSRAKWGIGGQGVGLWDGRVSEGIGSNVDARTAIGIDAPQRLLFLAVFESVSPRRAMQEMATLGARDAMLLDGGGSTAMVIGDGARDVQPGAVIGGLRPVATHFGIRARTKER
jgi:hypothetical protein